MKFWPFTIKNRLWKNCTVVLSNLIFWWSSFCPERRKGVSDVQEEQPGASASWWRLFGLLRGQRSRSCSGPLWNWDCFNYPDWGTKKKLSVLIGGRTETNMTILSLNPQMKAFILRYRMNGCPLFYYSTIEHDSKIFSPWHVEEPVLPKSAKSSSCWSSHVWQFPDKERGDKHFRPLWLIYQR